MGHIAVFLRAPGFYSQSNHNLSSFLIFIFLIISQKQKSVNTFLMLFDVEYKKIAFCPDKGTESEHSLKAMPQNGFLLFFF